MSSQEEIHSMPSPSKSEKKTWKRTNKVRSPPMHSPPSSARDSDVSNMFEVPKSGRALGKLRRPTQKFNGSSTSLDMLDSVSVSTSEMSDEVFEVTGNKSNSKQKSYKDKIKHRIQSVKSRAGSSSRRTRSLRLSNESLAVERIKKESHGVTEEIESVRSKYNLPSKRSDISDFFLQNTPVESKREDNENITEETDKVRTATQYMIPEIMKFNIDLSEKEQFFYSNGEPLDVTQKITSNEPRNLEQEGYYVQSIDNIPQKQLNKIEKRLLADDNKKWFDCNGDMKILHDPSVTSSFRPQIPSTGWDLTSYMHATKCEPCTEVLVIQNNVLELHIAHFSFEHHPLFSVEQVLGRGLERCYKTYATNLENNNLQRIKNQLTALRHVKKNLENLQQESGDDNNSKIDNCQKDIQLLRNSLLEEGKRERALLKEMLELWSTIKKVRQANKYSNTNLKLLIKKEKRDFEEDRDEYEEYFEETVREVLSEQDKKYKESMKKYKEELNLYKEGNQGDEEPPEKPVYDIDEEKIRLDLKKQFQESFRPPGEPIITLLLIEETEASNTTEDSKEILRRNILSSTKFFLRIICNNLEVCKTKRVHLSENFCCEVNETFSILLFSIPKFITIELVEQQKSLIRKKVCEINISLPTAENSKKSKKINEQFFKKEEIVKYKQHDGVGSGVNLNSVLQPNNLSVTNNFDINTSGFLHYSIAWEKSHQISEMKQTDVQLELFNNLIDKSGTINLSKFEEWIEQTTPDPQDPNNHILYEFSEQNRDLSSVCLKNTNHFRLDPFVTPLNFCNMNEIEENMRLTVLELRNRNEIEFDGMLVPNRIKELPSNILTKYKKRIEDENVFVDDELENGVESQRIYGRKYLEQIHTNIYQKCKNTRNHFIYEDVIDEKYVAYFQQMIVTFLKNVMNWFRWQPRIMLSIPRKSSTNEEIKSKMLLSNQVNVVMQIISAKNVPKRSAKEENGNKIEVKPFIQVFYNNLSYRTCASQGMDPVWNETVTIPLEPQNVDYWNPNSLNGVITVSLFDDIADNGVENEQFSPWLGSVKIPVSAICYSNTMQGFFKVTIPDFLLGYETQLGKQQLSTPRSNNNSPITTQFYTYIEMRISVTPNVPKLSPSMNELPYNEIPYLKEHIMNWNEMFNDNYPNRRFSAMAIDTNGSTCCIVRYITPIEPPQINPEEFTVTADQCARYVSLIPFTECNYFYQNIWLKTQELLDLMIGSVIDHAVALTCFLLALNHDVWLLLGYGIPYGSTAYVLLQETNSRDSELFSHFIYDVVDNKKYDILDPYCPLQRIYCLVNQENLWANVQRNDNISTTRFDLSRTGDWLPLFNNKFQVPRNSLNSAIAYKPKLAVDNIEKHLERKLKKKISKWRQLQRTMWNIKVAKDVRNCLRFFELNSMYNRNNNETEEQMQKILQSYQADGFLINVYFESVSSLVKTIKSLGVHLKKDEPEFVLATYVHSYGGRVLSVWLFLATIVPK